LAPSPEAVAEMVEQLNTICETLDAMPRRMRQVFILARMDGLPYGEVAAQLNISMNVVQKDMIQAWQHFYYAINQ
jgi:RNA polymerase sigma-70 factor (ECF subfamily)